jgi:hypothetical protein
MGSTTTVLANAMIDTMRWLLLLLMLAGVYPWIKGWLAVKNSSLAHALAWTVAAWLCWAGAFINVDEAGAMRYLSLCLTACAGVAVLGARRPHVAAWNFVVAGLLAVMALPLLENLVLGSRPIGAVRIIFLGATLLVVLVNFVPTSFGPAAILALLGCAAQMWALLAGDDFPVAVILGSHLAMALVPWIGWMCWMLRRRPRTELERRWLGFRDCFGAMWGLRVREQFNHAAEHAAWPVTLTWHGIAAKTVEGPSTANEAEMAADFQALIKRFSNADGVGRPS